MTGPSRLRDLARLPDAHRRYRIGDQMAIIYIRHDVTTLAEVNALALTDRQQNDAIVLSSTGYTCAWSLPYATRNEGVGRWEYDYDGVGHDYLEDGDKITVLVPESDRNGRRINAKHDRIESAMTALARKSTEAWTEGDMLDALFTIADALDIGLSATQGDDE